MAATRLSDSQKQELVARFRGGESTQALANHYGCSPNTISRVVKAALDPQDYETLKQQRSRRLASPANLAPEREPEPEPELELETAAEADVAAASEPEPAPPIASPPPLEPLESIASPAVVAPPEPRPELQLSIPVPHPAPLVVPPSPDPGPDPEAEEGTLLAIEDADDFGASDDEDSDEDSDEFEGDDDEGSDPFQPIAVAQLVDDHAVGVVLPLSAAPLATSAYLLVDKTVELQARPLSDFPELGVLPDGEGQRQALVLFINPRQAKRQCGRTQRVIKLPDPRLLERTAPYLLAQGISRVVMEGGLYALPES
jgi:transposase-like protein